MADENDTKDGEKTESIKRATTGSSSTHDTARTPDTRQLRGKVKIVTSRDILRMIKEIVESHSSKTSNELLTEITQVEFELVKMRHNMEILRKELDAAKEENLRKGETVKEHTRKLNEALETAERRENELRRLSEMLLARDEEHEAQVEKMQDAIEEAARSAQHQIDPGEMKALREEITAVQSELRMSEDIEEMQHSEIASLEEQLEKTRARYEGQIKKLSARIDQLEKELRRSMDVERKLQAGVAKVAEPGRQVKKPADLFGNVGVRLGYCNPEQVKEALQIQKDIAEMGLAPPKIGEVLVDKGHITPGQATDIFRAQTVGRPRIEGFDIISKLGEGLLGTTYRAKQLSLDREVAIKIIRPEFCADTKYAAYFISRTKQAGKLQHKNIARVIDAGKIRGTLYCISEFVRGQNLRDVLRKKKLPERQVLHVGLQVAAALVEASSNELVHGDIKPSNIIVNTEGVTKLCDFGIVRLIDLHTEFTLPLELFEGAYYAPPEVVRGGEPDERSDIYSLGATMFSLVTGHYPFGKARTPREALLSHLNTGLPDPRDKNPELSAGFAQIVMRMLESEPAERYQKPADVASTITGLVREKKSADTHRLTAPRRHIRRRRT